MRLSQSPISRCRAVVLVALFAFGPATARGEVTYSEDQDKQLTVVHMEVTPAAEAQPEFKHCLAARDIDLKPGNAASYYYRAMLESSKAMDRLRKEFGDEYDEWYYTSPHVPTSKLPVDKLRKADEMSLSGFAEEQLAEATLRRDCDWQLDLLQLRGPEVLALRLPEFQQSRELGHMLAVRARLAIAERRYDDAISALRMNYRLAEGTTTEPMLVCGLVGIAIAGVGNTALTELVAAPNSPNLYWALGELPQPLIEMRSAACFEVAIGERVYPLIHDAETTDHAPDEWNRLYIQTVRDISTMGGNTLGGGGTLGSELSANGFAVLGYSHAKERLIAQGMDREKVEAMSVGQVIAIYSERTYLRHADGFESLWYVPFWEMERQSRDVNERLAAARLFQGGVDCEVLPIASSLLPAMQSARSAQVRLDRDFAALRVIEALRMYAAEHAGGLPAKLEEIRQVPVPLNPATGKPFVYHLDGAVAVLELPLSDGFPGINRRYEIKIATSDK
jgi:hypothetical protein